MGIWETLTDVVDDAKKFLDGIDGLGSISKVLDPLDAAGTTLQAAGIGYATSPPLLIGQLQIDAMKLTMGVGVPERAEELQSSSAELEDAGKALVYADPQSDRWDGTAAQAYALANSEHRHQMFEIADADHLLANEIQAQAEEVTTARRLLQDKWDFLSDFDSATAWMSKVPGLGQAKMVADTAVAAEQTTEARITTAKLAWNSFDRASRVNALLDKYQKATDEEFPREFGQCGDPFGNEHLPGAHLPSRTQANRRYTPPDPEPAPTPSATPYAAHQPMGVSSAIPATRPAAPRPPRPSPVAVDGSASKAATASDRSTERPSSSAIANATRGGAAPVLPDRQNNRPARPDALPAVNES